MFSFAIAHSFSVFQNIILIEKNNSRDKQQQKILRLNHR